MTTITLKKTYASLPRTVRGQFMIVNGDPKGKNFLYCNGSQVYIRNVEDTSVCDIYAEHVKETTVAKYSPSGFYIASGDKEGKVRVWDTVNPEHILKKEHPVLGGAVKDLDWTSDNGKIAAVGEGASGTYGRVFTYDTGNSAGEVGGHSKAINAVSFKPTRPFRMVTAGEDFSSVFCEGPPFKFKCTNSQASNFVNCIRYAPNGEVFVAGGSEGKLWIYDGKTSELLGEIGEPKAHNGGIYSFCFSPDSKKLLSVSGDKTAKIWNMETKTCETEFVMGTSVNDMQVGCLWMGDHLLTVSLSGFINFLDPSSPSSPKKIIKGHSKPITSLAISADGSKIFTGAGDGLIIDWDSATSNNEDFKGKGHSNQITDMALDGEYLVSVAMDDSIRFSKHASQEFGEAIQLESQPRALDSKNGIAVVACINHIQVFEVPGKKLSSTPITNEALSCSIHPNGTEVAIGTNNSFTVYTLNNGTLTESRKETAGGRVNSLAYSPDGSKLCVAADKAVRFYDSSNWKDLSGNFFSNHTAKVTSVSWSPDSRRVMSASLDAKISLWDVSQLTNTKPFVKAHPMSHVNQLQWMDAHHVVTVGQDSNVKIWEISE